MCNNCVPLIYKLTHKARVFSSTNNNQNSEFEEYMDNNKEIENIFKDNQDDWWRAGKGKIH